MIQLNTDFDKINTYLQMGVSFNKTGQHLSETIVVDTMKTVLFWDYEGKSSMGFFAVWGVSYSFSEKLSLDFGISLETFQYTPTHNYLQTRAVNSIGSTVGNLPEIYRSVDFVDWVSAQYSQYPDPNKPLQLPKQTFTYDNLSFALGLRYRF